MFVGGYSLLMYFSIKWASTIYLELKFGFQKDRLELVKASKLSIKHQEIVDICNQISHLLPKDKLSFEHIRLWKYYCFVYAAYLKKAHPVPGQLTVEQAQQLAIPSWISLKRRIIMVSWVSLSLYSGWVTINFCPENMIFSLYLSKKSQVGNQ